MKKPKAYSLSIGGYEIIYKCAQCEYPFTMSNSKWLFCPQCGLQIDWGVVVQANEEWKQEFLSAGEDKEKRNKLLSQVDELNKTIKDNCRREMQHTEATSKAIRKSNAQYYLGIGWSKEELLNKGYAEEDFK